jgi:hypothetical protein
MYVDSFGVAKFGSKNNAANQDRPMSRRFGTPHLNVCSRRTIRAAQNSHSFFSLLAAKLCRSSPQDASRNKDKSFIA